jgi:hypothetical protein
VVVVTLWSWPVHTNLAQSPTRPPGQVSHPRERSGLLKDSNLASGSRVQCCAGYQALCLVSGAWRATMSESFEIIDPVEKFREAREEANSANIETARQGGPTRTKQGLWLAGAAVFSISTLIVIHTLGPRVGEFASGLNKQSASDRASQPRLLSRQGGTNPQALIPAPAASARGIHAIDPGATADQNSEDQSQASHRSAPLSTATSVQFAEADREQPGQVNSEAHDEDFRWVKTLLAATLHSGPSVSTPILTYYPVGTELRTAGQQNGWVKIVDPATSQQGWIYEIYLSPTEGPAQDALPQQPPSPKSEQLPTQAELEMPDESQSSAPDSSTPAAKSKNPRSAYDRHHARRAFVIRFGFGRFRF